MSITTTTGDDGETALMFGRRVSKTHPRIAAAGEIDELNAALGMARAHSTDARTTAAIAACQGELIGLMGELATLPEDHPRYAAAGWQRVTAREIGALTEEAAALEKELNTRFHGWAVPGADTTLCGAALDVARAVCRRAERAVLTVGGPVREHHVYLNRLSDFLWLLARREAMGAIPAQSIK